MISVGRGDREGFGLLLRRHQDAVYGFLRMTLRDPARAEDAAQEVFLRVYRSASKYEPVAGRFRAWLFTIAANVARNHQARHRPIADLSLDAMPSGSLVAAEEPDSTDASELRRQVSRALDAIPPEQRDVVLLKEFQGMTFDEVAQALDIPVNTAKSRLRYGILKLAELLRGYGAR